MPMRPLKPCRYPGCPELCSGRFCLEHERCEEKHITSRRQTDPALILIDAWYDTADWRGLKAEQLRRFPLCASCSRPDSPVAASEVDHIHPIRLGGLKRSFANFQSLCKPCHDRKQQAEALEARCGKPRPKAF